MHLTPASVDSVVGIDASEAAAGPPNADAPAAVNVVTQTRAPDAAATSTPKRASGLGAVRKAKTGAPSSTAEQQPQDVGSSSDLTASAGVSEFVPAIISDSTQLLSPCPIVHTTDTHGDQDNMAASVQESERSPLPPVVVAERDGNGAAAVALTQAPAAAFATSAQPVNSSNETQAPAAPERIATAENTESCNESNADGVSDKLKRRELQLEVSEQIACMNRARARWSSHSVSLKVLAAQLGASEQARVLRRPVPCCSQRFHSNRPPSSAGDVGCSHFRPRVGCGGGGGRKQSARSATLAHTNFETYQLALLLYRHSVKSQTICRLLPPLLICRRNRSLHRGTSSSSNWSSRQGESRLLWKKVWSWRLMLARKLA